MKDRGGRPAASSSRNGYIVAEWGEPKRVDMTNSVTKTFLTTVVGLAWQRGLIRDVNDYARDYMPPGRRPVRGGAQPEDQVGSPAAPDERLAGHAVGQARLGRSARRREAGRLAEPAAARAGHALQVQRRPRQRDGAGRAAGVAAAAAAGAARGSDGADRRVVHVALVRLRELVGRHRRPESAVGERAAATGAAACSSTRTTWRASAICSCATASGRIARSCPRSGSRWRARRARPTTTYGFANWYLNTDRKPCRRAPETRGPLRRQRQQHHLHRLGKRSRHRDALVEWA